MWSNVRSKPCVRCDAHEILKRVGDPCVDQQERAPWPPWLENSSHHLSHSLSKQMNCLFQSLCRPIACTRTKKRPKKGKQTLAEYLEKASSQPVHESPKYDKIERSPERTRQETTVVTDSLTYTTASISFDPYGIPLVVVGDDNDEMSMMSCSIMRPSSKDFESSDRWLEGSPKKVAKDDPFDNIWDHNNDEIDENASHDDYTRVSI